MSKTLEITYSKTFELPGAWEKIGTKEQPMKGDTMESVLDTVAGKIQSWHEKHNPELYKQGKNPKSVTEVNDKVIDEEWEGIKNALAGIEFMEDAQEFINTTSYAMTIEAKKIINNKPTKK